MDWDHGLVLWLNQYAGLNRKLDAAVILLSRNMLLRGGAIVGLLWWAWMHRRERLICAGLFWPKTVVGIVLALAAARAMQNLLPARVRPTFDPGSGFQPLLGPSYELLRDWSSFLSDHAVLFAALCVAIFRVDHRFGWIAVLWTAFAIPLPRIYLGLHYPSDVLAGALIGAGIMLAIQALPAPAGATRALRRLEDRHRGLAYGGLFIFGFLTATLFNDVREVVGALTRIARELLG